MADWEDDLRDDEQVEGDLVVNTHGLVTGRLVYIEDHSSDRNGRPVVEERLELERPA